MKEKKLSCSRILFYGISVCLMVCVARMWRATGVFPYYLARYPAMILCGIYILLKGKLYGRQLLYAALLAGFWMVYIVVRPYQAGALLKSVVCVWIAFIAFAYTVVRSHDEEAFLTSFSDVMIVVAAVSLFFWLFGTMLHVIPGKAMTFEFGGVTRSTVSYFSLYYENAYQKAAFNLLGVQKGLLRNTSVFVEAPAYSSILSFALIIELFVRRHKKRVHVVILIITLLSTLSTKGVLFVGIVALFWLFRDQAGANSRWITLLKTLAVPAVGLAVLLVLYRLLTMKMGTGSYTERTDILMAQLKAWKENLLFGTGFSDLRIAKYITINQQLYTEKGKGYSLGITVTLAYGGLYLLSLYVLPLIRPLFMKMQRYDKSVCLEIAALQLVNFAISNLFTNIPFIMFLSFMYAYFVFPDTVRIREKEKTPAGPAGAAMPAVNMIR